MKRKNIILLSFLFIAVGVAAYFFFFRDGEQSFLWRTFPVERGNVRVAVMATGSINALTTVQVGTQVSGTIAKLFVDFNSVVKKGQVIALLDTIFLSAAKDDAEAILEKAAVQLNQMKIEFERVKKLYDENVLARAEYDLAVTNYESAKSTSKSAVAQLNRAKINLQYATILAPISGVVISRDVDVGQTVVASFNSPVLFTIANDLTKMQVYANIDEADIGQIKTGQEVSFTVDAYPNENFFGEIKQIRLQPNVIQNVVNYTVIVDVPNPDLKLLPGLTANINVKILDHKNILKVQFNTVHFIPPPEYLKTETSLSDSLKKNWKNNPIGTVPEGTIIYLWVKKGESISPRKVRAGLTEGGYVEISGDLKEGEEVVAGLQKEESSTQPTNPFMPKFQAHGKR